MRGAGRAGTTGGDDRPQDLWSAARWATTLVS